VSDRLSNRQLNRAALARQLLLQRVSMTPAGAIEQLVGLQAQAPSPPYVALWTRLRDFSHQQLSDLLTTRKAVRVVLMRSTIHLVTARDCIAHYKTLEPVQHRLLLRGSPYGRNIQGLDLDALAQYGRKLVEAQARTLGELRPLLAKRWPKYDGQSMAFGIRNLLPLVQIPPRGVWGQGGLPLLTTADSWLQKPMKPAGDVRALVLRYLAAFGPASVRDAQAWSGLSGLADVFERLRKRLRTFRSETGTELFDLPDAARPAEDVMAPVRLLGEFDNVLLSYADRSRIVDDDHRRRIGTLNGMMPGTILVDGRVAGIWRIERNRRSAVTLRIYAFKPLPAGAKRQAAEEGDALLRFMCEGVERRDVRISPLRSL
jgi:hypothetical protein